MTPLQKLIQEKAKRHTKYLQEMLTPEERFEALNIQDSIEEDMIEIANAVYEDVVEKCEGHCFVGYGACHAVAMGREFKELSKELKEKK